MESVNIVLFGETGVGKSSVINIIAGSQVAPVFSNARDRSSSAHQYTFLVGGRAFNVWDTVGLEEPESAGTASYVNPIAEGYELIRKLEQGSGIDLLIFCMQGRRLTGTTQSNYRIFYEILRRSHPTALVITHLEHEADMDAWWARNLPSMKGYGIRNVEHACVTGLPTHPQYAQSKTNMEQLLSKFTMPASSWLMRLLGLFRLVFGSPQRDLSRKKMVKVLTKRCRLNLDVAEELAARLTGQC